MRTRVFPLLLVMALVAGPAAAAVFVVNAAGDQHDATPGDGVCKTAGNACTLRAAVDEANLTTDARVVRPAIAVTLSDGDLVLTKSVTITGAGMRKTSIKASPGSRIFTIAADFIRSLTTA